jgi:hypothetical protein
MIRARIYTQGPPIAIGTEFIDGERVQIWKPNFIDSGIVEGVTSAECWQRAKSITPKPVMEWI